MFYWVIFTAIVIVAALALRFYSNQQLGVYLNVSSITGNTVFPYQQLTFYVSVGNTGGSTISELPIEVLVNGNATTNYRVSIPVGKSTMFAFNYTPKKAGNYSIDVIADPGKLYNLADRSYSRANTTLSVFQAAKAQPSTYVSANGAVSFGMERLNGAGIKLSGFAAYNYQVYKPFVFSEEAPLVGSIINLTSDYLVNSSTAYAYYPNGASIYSTWLQGYLSPSIFEVASSAHNLVFSNVSISDMSIGMTKLSNTSTMCSWYEGGWFKILVYTNVTSSTCASILNSTTGKNANQSVWKTLYNSSVSSFNFTAANYTELGSFAFSNHSSVMNGSIVSNSSAVVMAFLSDYKGSYVPCYGVIATIANNSFCNTYLLPSTQSNATSVSLIRTMELVNGKNASVLTLVNSSQVFAVLPTAYSIINHMHLNGTSYAFKNGFASTCSFASMFNCTGIALYNGNITFTVHNLLNSSVFVNKAVCARGGSFTESNFVGSNVLVKAHENATIITTCYENNTVVTGIPVGMSVLLGLNYTAENTTGMVYGTAVLNAFS